MKYDQTIESVFKRFPEFANSQEFEVSWDREFPHSVYPGFAEYFIRLVARSKKPEKNPKIIEICKFLDEMATSEDKGTRDLLITGFFEWVYGHSVTSKAAKRSVAVLQKFLNEPARTYLKNLMEWRPK